MYFTLRAILRMFKMVPNYFVREQAKDEYGKTMGFVNFGPVDFVKSEGSQPMNITWKLKHPMPAYLWHETAKLAVG